MVVSGVEQKKENKLPPLLYNLAELQNDCSRFFKLNPDETLRYTQELYEKKLVTYPRTDARVLSTAVAKEIGKAEYLLLPRSAYYEFLPLDSDKTLKITEISVGECYELVITTFSGLYRYKTGDVLRILSFDGECPVFEIEGRRNRTINVAGEKLDEQIVRDAVMRFAQQSNTHIFDFAVGVKDCEAPFGYALFLETERSIEKGAELFDMLTCTR